MANIKISQLPAKGANLAAEDLLEVSEFTGTGYVSKSITGQEIIDAAAGGSGVTAVTATAPIISTGGTTPNLSMDGANGSDDGFLKSTDWNTFNNKQNAITLTTTGTSGAATLVGSTLNIPQYSGGGASGIHTQFKLPSGSIYSNIALGANSASQALTSGLILIMPFKPAQTFTTSNFLISTTVAAALSTTRILLYSHSDTNGLPDIKLYESADLDTSTTGLKTAITSQTFTAGTTYWFGVYSNAAPTLAATTVASLIQIGMSSSNLTQNTAISRTVVYGFAPSIWGVSGNLISSNFPRIGLTIA